MAKKNTVEMVKDRMVEMLAKRAEEVAKLTEESKKVQAQKEEAEAKLKAATEEIDMDAYETAKADIKKAETALELYSARYSQIKHKEVISEEESDKVIDSLIQYEKDLDAQFMADIEEPLRRLQEINQNYLNTIRDTEITIRNWENNIHANYRNSSGGRNNYKTFVHPVTHQGCRFSLKLREFLAKSPINGRG